jgi:hypothetical protein
MRPIIDGEFMRGHRLWDQNEAIRSIAYTDPSILRDELFKSCGSSYPQRDTELHNDYLREEQKKH